MEEPSTDATQFARQARIEAAEFARQIMREVYGYRFCETFATFQDGTPEVDDWCLTHDQSRRHCRDYQDSIVGPLTALIEARDALADPADRDESVKYFRAAVFAADVGHKRAKRAEAELERIRLRANEELVEDEDGAPYPAEVQDALAHLRIRAEHAEAEVSELRETVERVRALHVRCSTPGWPDTCDEEDFDWPCRTIRALDPEDGTSTDRRCDQCGGLPGEPCGDCPTNYHPSQHAD